MLTKRAQAERAYAELSATGAPVSTGQLAVAAGLSASYARALAAGAVVIVVLLVAGVEAPVGWIYEGCLALPVRWEIPGIWDGCGGWVRSAWSGDEAALDKWAERVTSTVGPMVAGLAGNAGAVFLIDREANRALTLTLWDSEQAALASDQAAEQSRASTVAATGVELVDRGRYEVVARL